MNSFLGTVCAGFVLYNPDLGLLKNNIDHIKEQVATLFFYDNHSDNIEDIERLILECTPKYVLLKGNENKGIAYGLNRLLHEAHLEGFDWILTMDQDSICCSDMIKKYLDVMDNFDDKVAMYCPFVLNNNKISYKEYESLTLNSYDYVLDANKCITSGCMTNVRIVLGIGGFDEKLFIDYVDTELNMRLNLQGYTIVRVNSAYMFQQMGKAKRIPFFDLLFKVTHFSFFRKMRYATVYNNIRLYYISRNSKYIRQKYKKVPFRLTASYIIGLFLYFSVTYPVSRNRWHMWKSMYRGYKESIC